MIAFCVAATNSNDHFVKAYTKRLKELDLTDEELVELLLVIDLTNGYNRYVQGLLLQGHEAVVRPRSGDGGGGQQRRQRGWG